MRVNPGPWSEETRLAAPHDVDRSDEPPTVCDVTKLLASDQSDGLSPFDAARHASARYHADPDVLVHCCVLERAHEQWTDGELLSLLETDLAPLLVAPARVTLELHHESIVRVRQLARGELRTRAWELLDAMRSVVVGEAIVEVPDNSVRWATLKEMQRQYCGWTAKGMAAKVQDEIDAYERGGGVDLPERDAPRH